MARPYRNEKAITCWMLDNGFSPNETWGKYVKARNDDELEQSFITYWDADVLGIAQPNQATLDSWEDDCPIVAEEIDKHLIVTESTPLALSGESKTSLWQLTLAASFTVNMSEIEVGPAWVTFVLNNDLLVRTVTFGTGFSPTGLSVIGVASRSAIISFVRVNTLAGYRLVQATTVIANVLL